MKDARTIDRPAASGPRTHDIGPGGTVVISTGVDSIVVRAVDGHVAGVVGPDDLEILTEATPGRFVVSTRSAPEWPTADGGRGWFGSLFSLGRGGRVIELDVPRDARLEANTASGAVRIHGLRVGVAVHTASGDVAANDVGGDLEVATASGAVALRGSDGLAARVRTASGDVSIVAARLTDLSVSTLSGTVRVQGRVGPGLDGTVSTASGSVRLALGGGATLKVRTISGRAASTHPTALPASPGPGWTIGDGSGRVAVSTISGAIRLEAPSTDDAPPPAGAGQAAGSAAEPAATAATAAPPTDEKVVVPQDVGRPDDVTLAVGPQGAEQSGPSGSGGTPSADDAALDVLRALERGEITVDEAASRLDRSREVRVDV